MSCIFGFLSRLQTQRTQNSIDNFTEISNKNCIDNIEIKSIDRFLQAFQLLKNDESECLEIKYLKKIMHTFQYFICDVELQTIFKEFLNFECNGAISFKDFTKLMDTFDTDNGSNEEAFRIFDQQNKGFITKSDLNLVLQKLGISISDEESKYYAISKKNLKYFVICF